MTSVEHWPLDPADFDWSSEDSQREARSRLVELTKKASFASYNEVVETYAAFAARVPELIKNASAVLRECDWPSELLHPGESVEGIVSAENTSHVWLILSKEKQVVRDFEVLEIDLGRRSVQQDGWTVLASAPLLVASIFGAVVGFRKNAGTTQEILVVDGESGWD